MYSGSVRGKITIVVKVYYFFPKIVAVMFLLRIFCLDLPTYFKYMV